MYDTGLIITYKLVGSRNCVINSSNIHYWILKTKYRGLSRFTSDITYFSIS